MDGLSRAELRESLELIPSDVMAWVWGACALGELAVMTLTQQHRAVHDFVAGTRVIDVRPGADAAREVIPRQRWWGAAAYGHILLGLFLVAVAVFALAMPAESPRRIPLVLVTGLTGAAMLLFTGFLFARRLWAQRALAMIHMMMLIFAAQAASNGLGNVWQAFAPLAGLLLLVRARPAFR
jgi:hypothetical protein